VVRNSFVTRFIPTPSCWKWLGLSFFSCQIGHSLLCYLGMSPLAFLFFSFPFALRFIGMGGHKSKSFFFVVWDAMGGGWASV
jgi:hypothetical protein